MIEVGRDLLSTLDSSPNFGHFIKSRAAPHKKSEVDYLIVQVTKEHCHEMIGPAVPALLVATCPKLGPLSKVRVVDGTTQPNG